MIGSIFRLRDRRYVSRHRLACAVFFALLAVLLIPVAATASRERAHVQTAARCPKLPTLTITTGTASTVYGAIWVALGDQLFKKYCVPVKVLTYNALTTGTSLLVAGRVDLLITSTVQGMEIAAQGQQTSMIYNLYNFNPYFAALTAKSSITSLSQLASMGTNCEIADGGPGGGLRAYAVSVEQAYGIRCKIVGFANEDVWMALVTSGQVDAAVSDTSHAYAAKAAGRGNVLVDPATLTKADAKKLAPVAYPQLGIWGMQSNLQSKRRSVVQFLKALREASALILSSSSNQLAEWSLKIGGAPFGTTPQSAMAASWAVSTPGWPTGAKAGYITSAQWNILLQNLGPGGWQVPNWDPTIPTIQYNKIVDMSYFNAAVPAKAKKKKK